MKHAWGDKKRVHSSGWRALRRKQLERPRLRLKDDIKTALKEISFGKVS
jgi:hypothetical protein